jgi:hypothetical protein
MFYLLPQRGHGSKKTAAFRNALRGGVLAAIIVAGSNSNANTAHTNDASSAPIRMTVTGDTRGLHDVASESERVGPANQPEWTTRRAFAEADIYVLPRGEFEFNQFYVSSHPRHGKPANIFETEFALGLPWRTQFDVELNYAIEGGRLKYDSTRLEAPHALADWGKLPLNPALDFGWRFNEGTDDAYLFRLLLAEEFSERLHFGANLGFERQIGGDLETEYELNLALSYVALNQKLTIGAEFLAEYETEEDGDDATTVLLGPSILFKPTKETHLGLVGLAGLTHDSPALEVFLIFGFELEPFAWLGSRAATDDLQPVRRPR